MRKIDYGHFRSQKFAALVFCVFVLFCAAFFLAPEIFSTLTMGVVALFGAFVGARTLSDNAALKFGGTVGTPDATSKPAAPATTVKKAAIVAAPAKEDPREVD